MLGLSLTGGVSAAERLWFDDRQLELKAQARACYLGFIKLYDADFFRNQAASTSCVRLSYLRDFDAESLGEATEKVFEDRHGSDVVSRYRSELDQVASAYRSVEPGDRYLYCLGSDGAGNLMRDDAPTLRLPSTDFARRFLQIWVKGEDDLGNPQWGFGSC
jgi:hypothetical protein